VHADRTDPDGAGAPGAVEALGGRLPGLGWVSDLWVAGSLVTGDHVPGVSDLDLVAVTDGPVDEARQTQLRAQAVEQAAAPEWLEDQLRTRRRGAAPGSPRLRTAWIAWRDARRTLTGLGR
jgi:hypothetical protein